MKGYKPLAFDNGNLLLFHKGDLFLQKDGSMQKVFTLSGGIKNKLKMFCRLSVRLFRCEPRQCYPIGNKRYLAVYARGLFVIDLKAQTMKKLFSCREGFSDLLNVCVCPSGAPFIALFGDYGSNASHEAVHIYALYPDDSVQTIFTFAPGQIRHVHNILSDQNGGYFILTGDTEPDAGIYHANETMGQIEPVCTGSQQYRAVFGVSTQQGLLYATDSVTTENHLYLLQKDTPREICPLHGSVIYGTAYKNGCVFSTTVEPDETVRGILSYFSNKRGAGIRSNAVKVMQVDASLHVHEVASYQKDKMPMKLFQYGCVQFAQNQQDRDTCVGYGVALQKKDGKILEF